MLSYVTPPEGVMLVHRRKAHVVTLSTDGLVTVPAWGLYWSQDLEMTFVCVNEYDGVGLFVPMFKLLGYWDWYTGEIERFVVADGYGVHKPRAKRRHIRPSKRIDRDGNRIYWLTFDCWRLD